MKNLKPIEWDHPVPFIPSWWAHTIFGKYFIYAHDGWYTCEYKYQKSKSFRFLDAAKAHCFAHYAASVAALFDEADAAKGTS